MSRGSIVRPEEELSAHKPHVHEEEEHSSLRGTFVAVMLLGLLIVGCWIGVFTLFVSRQ